MAEALNPDLQARVNARLNVMLASFYEAAPAARYLATSSSVDKALFERHTIETVLRIRLGRIINSKAVVELARSDAFAAQKWAKYTEEEMLHDRLFLKDLKNLGVSEAAVDAQDTMVATKLLQGYLYFTLEHEGPRGVLTKSYFLEYVTNKTQAAWNENVKRSLGDRATKGAESHYNYDADEDHSADVWNVLTTLVKTPADEARVFYHLDVYYGLFVAYFQELAAITKSDLVARTLEPAEAVIQGAQRAGQLAPTSPV